MSKRDCEKRATIRPRTGPAKEVAQDVVGLDWPTPLDITKHRRSKQRPRCRKHRACSFEEIEAWRKTLRCRNRRAFVEKPNGEIRGSRRNNVADRRAHQTGDTGPCRDKHPFLPHFLQDRFAEARLEKGAG